MDQDQVQKTPGGQTEMRLGSVKPGSQPVSWCWVNMVPTSHDLAKVPTSTLAQAQVSSGPMAVGSVTGEAASAFWVV